MANSLRSVFINKLSLVLIAGFFLISMSHANAQCGANLVINGDFELGATGFTTDYVNNKSHAPNIIEPGEYDIAINPNHPCFSGPDHTIGHPPGKAMYVNGSLVPNKTVWQETITVNLNTDYNLSAWINQQCGLPNAQLQFSINDVNVGPIFTPSAVLYLWTQYSTLWNSGGNTSAKIRLVDLSLSSPSNDFGLDDISFVKKFPGNGPTESVTSTPVSCPNGSNGSITITAAGLTRFSGHSYILNSTKLC